jgi:hypothetical protein
MTALQCLQMPAAQERTVLAFPRCPTAGRLAQTHAPTDEERIDLDRLRWLALRSRLAPRPDLERACFLLAAGTGASLERYSIAFFRGLADHASREMTVYRPGARSASDDEIWMLRLIAAWRRGEESAAAALVAWRVEKPHRRWMRFLSAGLVRALDEMPV